MQALRRNLKALTRTDGNRRRIKPRSLSPAACIHLYIHLAHQPILDLVSDLATYTLMKQDSSVGAWLPSEHSEFESREGISIHSSSCPSVHLSVYQSVRLPVCQSVRLLTCPHVRLSACQSVCQSVSLLVYPPTLPPSHPSVRPSIHPSSHPSTTDLPSHLRFTPSLSHMLLCLSTNSSICRFYVILFFSAKHHLTIRKCLITDVHIDEGPLGLKVRLFSYLKV